MYDFTAKEDTDLTLTQGEEYTILHKQDQLWWRAQDKHGNKGFIPSNYVTEKDRIEANQWYCQSITRSEAEQLLRKEAKEGGFVVRESSQQGCYTVSVFTKALGINGGIRHYQIKLDDSGSFYLCEKHIFTTIPELIEYHNHNAAAYTLIAYALKVYTLIVYTLIAYTLIVYTLIVYTLIAYPLIAYALIAYALIAYMLITYTLIAYTLIAYMLIAYTLIAYTLIAYTLIAYTLIAYTLIAYTLIAYTLIGYTLIGYTLIAYTLIAYTLIGYTLIGYTLIAYTLIGYTLLGTGRKS
eukprot:XP_014039260.1 PREDICTED: tyrosine-protein kinase Tec-like [Salmo salar]